MFSTRCEVGLEPNSLSQALARHLRSGRPHLDLTLSNPTRAELPYAESALLAALATRELLDYDPQPFGLRSARDAVARDYALHGTEVAAERVLLTASTSEAYAFLFKLLCDPGDEVLCPRPSYPLFDSLARLEGVRLAPYPLVYDGAWGIDLAALQRARAPRTRALLLVNPNNPTGHYLKRNELELLRSLELPIVSDEVFSRYAHGPDPARVESLAGETDGLVFALGGLSKLAALPQLKLAWTVVAGAAERAAEAIARLEFIADAFLSVSTPVQLALPALLAAREPTERAIAARLRSNRELLAAAAAGSAASLLRTEGGWYAILRVPAILSDEDWAVELLEQCAVYVHPGHFFDLDAGAHLVLSLLTPPSAFREGVTRLLAFVRARCERSPDQPLEDRGR